MMILIILFFGKVYMTGKLLMLVHIIIYLMASIVVILLVDLCFL